MRRGNVVAIFGARIVLTLTRLVDCLQGETFMVGPPDREGHDACPCRG